MPSNFAYKTAHQAQPWQCLSLAISIKGNLKKLAAQADPPPLDPPEGYLFLESLCQSVQALCNIHGRIDFLISAPWQRASGEGQYWPCIWVTFIDKCPRAGLGRTILRPLRIHQLLKPIIPPLSPRSTAIVTPQVAMRAATLLHKFHHGNPIAWFSIQVLLRKKPLHGTRRDLTQFFFMHIPDAY